MAKPVEIPFSKVYDRKSVKTLTMTAFGGFVRIALAALEEGIDPFAVSHPVLMRYANCNPQQWTPCRKAILNALGDALPSLREAYEIALKKKANQKAMGKYFYEKGLGPMKRAATLRNLNAKVKAVSFEPQVTAPVILRPTKIQRYRSEKVDLQVRENALKSKKLTSAGLHD